MTAPGKLASAPGPRSASGKYLTISVGGQEYGLPILSVKEIVGLLPITRVPNAPTHVLGVVNLRGKVIPVVDVRHRLGLPPADPAPRACVVVVRLAEEVPLGLLVDAVVEVVQVDAKDLEDTPGLTTQGGGVIGLAKIGGRVTVLLDVDQLLGGDGGSARATHGARS